MRVLLAIIIFLSAFTAWSAILDTDGSDTDVQAQIDAAISGDTIRFPVAGSTNEWTARVRNNGKQLHFLGAGTNSTRIIHSVDPDRLMELDGEGYSLKGIRFDAGTATKTFNGVIQLSGTNFVVRDCHFESLVDDHLFVRGYGVVANCTFQLDSSNTRVLMVRNGDMYGSDRGDGSWETPVNWGSREFVYLEDCRVVRTLQAYGIIDGWQGGRVVVRNCEIIGSGSGGVRISNHGTESSQHLRSMRAMEIYNNTIDSNTSGSQGIYTRGGTTIAFSNTWTGASITFAPLDSYRERTQFAPWNIADGTMAWDDNDLTDGAGTPGGAGDGVFEAGTFTSTGVNTATDSSQSWTTDEWDGYVVRETHGFTATSGGVRTATVSGAGWTTDEWAGYAFTRTSGSEKGAVTSNTSDTLTLSISYYAVDMSGGGDFVLSHSAAIESNTSTQLTVHDRFDGGDYTFKNGSTFEIRKVSRVLDGPGAGQTDDFVGSTTATRNHQDLNQQTDPCYEWENTLNGADADFASGYPTVVEGRDYFNDTEKPGYTPFEYPHPLLGTPAATVFKGRATPGLIGVGVGP